MILLNAFSKSKVILICENFSLVRVLSFKFKSELRFNRLKLDHDKIDRVLHIIIYKLCNRHRAALVRDVAKINPSLLLVRNSADGAAVTVNK